MTDYRWLKVSRRSPRHTRLTSINSIDESIHSGLNRSEHEISRQPSDALDVSINCMLRSIGKCSENRQTQFYANCSEDCRSPWLECKIVYSRDKKSWVNFWWYKTSATTTTRFAPSFSAVLLEAARSSFVHFGDRLSIRIFLRTSFWFICIVLIGEDFAGFRRIRFTPSVNANQNRRKYLKTANWLS